MRIKFKLDKWKSVSIFTKDCETIIRWWGWFKFDYFQLRAPIIEKENWNNYIKKENLNRWNKVDKDNFTPPKRNINIVFFTKNGGIFCGEYKGNRGFVCYGIGARELTDVEVTHWRNLDFPGDYQDMLDDMDNKHKYSK